MSTLGPWKVVSGAVYTQDDRPIADMVRNEEASKAGIYPVERDDNARLIAAAPELLEACKKTAAIVIDGYDAGNTELNEAWDACVEAIAHATDSVKFVKRLAKAQKAIRRAS